MKTTFSLRQVSIARLASAAVLLFSVVFYAMFSQAQDQCTAGPSCFVQYKVAEAELSKCGFQEFTNVNPPRVKIYHDENDEINYSFTRIGSGNNAWANHGTDPNCANDDRWLAGPYSLNNSYTISAFTHQQSITGAACDFSETYTGDVENHQSTSDARNFDHNDCTGCDWGETNSQYTLVDDSSPEYVLVNGSDTWAMVGSHNELTFITGGWASVCSGNCAAGTCSNETDYGYTNTPIQVGIPSQTYLAVLTQTHEEYDLSDPDNGPGTNSSGQVYTDTESGSETRDLSDEYTDDELYGNIMGLMPAYPAGWYVPSADDYNFWDMVAYSVIDGDHVNGANWTATGGAALQQMEYQFCVPDSQAFVAYQVKWNLLTYDVPTGSLTTTTMSTTIFGTGDPVNPALSSIQYAAPPDWDSSMDPLGGYVVTWVDDISISVVSSSGNSAAPGSGPGSNSGIGGTGCNSCGAGGGGSGSSGGLFAQFSLGRMTNGYSLAPLQISAAQPSLATATPAGLMFTMSDSNVQIIQSGGQIRQVVAPETFVDVVSNNAFSYDLRFYLPSQRGSLSDGIYQVSGSPFVTWTVANPDASTNIYNRLQLTETRGADVKTYTYAFTNHASWSAWTLDYPSGLREDEWDSMKTLNEDGTYSRALTNIIRVPGGATEYKSVNVYQNLNGNGGAEPGFVIGGSDSLMQQTVDPDNNPKTTTYSYNLGGNAFGTTKPVQLVAHPDGSWEYYANFDSLTRPGDVYSSYGDEPAPSGGPDSSQCRDVNYSYAPVSSDDDGTLYPYVPRRVITYIKNEAVSVSYVVMLPGERQDIQCPNPSAGWNDPANLVTVTKYYTSGVNVNRVQSMLRPDGTMSIYQYGWATDGSQTNIVYTGQPNVGKTAITDGTETLTVLGPVGQMISATTVDIASGIVLSQDTYGNYDSLNRPQQVTHLDGTTEQTQYSCCGVDNTTDRDGVLTQFYYDAMKRQTASSRLNITTTNVLDAVGHTLETIRIGSDSSHVVTGQSSFDVGGQLISQTNGLGGVTTFIHANDPSTSARIEITLNPDGGKETNFYYVDGSLKETAGTAAHGTRYAYDVGYPYQQTTEVKLNADGSDTSEAVTNFSDALGRPTQTFYSDGSTNQSLYNSAGQLWKSVDPDGVETLYQYNAKGEQEYTATDMDRNDTIDFAGTDRITQTLTDVTTDHGVNVQRARTYVWQTGGVDSGTLVSTTESSTDGLQNWETRYRDASTPVTAHSQTAYSGTNRTVTVTAPDGSYTVSTYSSGRLASTTRYGSFNNQLSSVSYSYNAHGRQYQVTDARNGATTYGYNNADLVSSVTTPSPGNGQSAETTLTYYNTTLQATNVVQPDNTSAFSLYLPTGELLEQYGSRTYPVGYSYDYAGRMKTMTNWSNFSGNSGARVTTWDYDSYRGFLTSKTYDGGAPGPSYTYTAAGRLQTRVWARGITTTYSYDNAGSLTNVSYSDSTPGAGYAYDRQGRQSNILCNGITDSFAYNLADELLSESNSGGLLNGLSVTNGYDQYLRRTNVVSLNGAAVLARAGYGYDNASRLSSVSDGTNSATYSYIANSPLVGQITFKSNSFTAMTTSKSYDYLNRALSISNTPTSGPGVNFNYSYNPANQRTSVTNLDGSYWVYQYDTLGQVTSGKKYWRDGTPVAGQQFGYTFDTIGNRTQTETGGDQNGANLRTANYSANNLNQVTSRDVPGYVDVKGVSIATNTVTVNGQTAYRKWEYFRDELPVTNSSSAVWTNITVAASGQTSISGDEFVPKQPEAFSYDADGNLTNDGRFAYVWNGENRLIQMTVNTNVGPQYQLTFAYDAKGRRLQKVVAIGGVSTYTNKFLYDGWNLVAVLNPQSSLLQSFLWGSDLSGSLQGAGGVGGLLEESFYGTATTNCFVAYDGNGNVGALVNAADGTVLANYEYGPFGEVIRGSGPMAKLNPLRFSTRYYEDETDLIMYPVRPYSPLTGRWLSRDTLEEEGGLNLYEFAGNAPIQFIDPFGYEWHVLRMTSGNRAAATCDCGDTVAELAAKIHLDPADYTKWLNAAGNSQLPASADTPLPKGSTFTIPNRVYINDLLSLWGKDILLVTAFRQWERVEVRDLSHEGFKVIPVKDTLSAQLLSQLGDADVQGIVVIAHGDPDAQGDFSDAGPGYVTPDQAAGALHHKLAGFKAIWCWSGVKQKGWRALVSPTGYLWSCPGYVKIWHSYPGVIQHGLKDE